MELVKVLPRIFGAAERIYDISKKVKANKKQYLCFGKRVERVVDVLDEGSIHSSNEAMERALQSLAKTLEEGAEFMTEFTDSSTLGRFWRNTDHQEKFKELNSRLSDNVHDLNLALNFASVFDQQQDVIDLQADLAEILSKLDETALEMANQQQELESHTYRNSELEALIDQSQCVSVNLKEQQLTDSDIKIVVQHAIVHKRCNNLFLECNKIKSGGISILANVLHSNTTLYELWLHGNQVSDVGAHYLATALSVNKTLKKLGLASNNITNTGVSHLADMIKKNNALIMLGLAANKIGNRGVQMLADAIGHQNTTIQVLTLDRNKFVSDSSVDLLINMIKQNRSMKELWINDCSLSEAGKTKLREMIASREDFELVTEYK